MPLGQFVLPIDDWQYGDGPLGNRIAQFRELHAGNTFVVSMLEMQQQQMELDAKCNNSYGDILYLGRAISTEQARN